MKTLKNNYEAIRDYLNEECTGDELINYHNITCEEYNYMDDMIFEHNEEFYETFFFNKAEEAVMAAFYGDLRYCDKYVKFNGYGNLETFNYPEEHIDETQIAECIQEHPESFDIELED